MARLVHYATNGEFAVTVLHRGNLLSVTEFSAEVTHRGVEPE
jgi:hypothetical protein